VNTLPDTEKQGTTFDQASREATGARPYGRFLEDFEEGAVYKHWPAKTVTEADDHLFCLITMNHHPLHINDVYAAQSQQGRNVVVGPLVYSLALGMSVGDISGKAIANLATEELSHPAPVFHGDTLYAESEVLEVRPSQSKADRGVVKVRTDVYNHEGAHGRLQPALGAGRDLSPSRARAAPQSRQLNPAAALTTRRCGRMGPFAAKKGVSDPS
jgi:acyl dehydratase